MLFQKITGEGEVPLEKTAGGLDGVLRGGFDEDAVRLFQDVDPTARGNPVFLSQPFGDEDLTFLGNLDNGHGSTLFKRKFNFFDEVVKN